MFLLVLKNTRRQLLRTILTAFGIAVALLAFCLIRTIISAWYSGVENSAKNRVIVRNAVSLVFSLPINYVDRIAQVPGIDRIGYANWFGGIYKEERFRFAQFAVDANYLDLYPEFLLSEAERRNYESDRKGILIGSDLASQFGLGVGDAMPIKGTIFPGDWEFTVRGIINGRDSKTTTRLCYFHWDYLNERNKAELNRQPDHVGIIVVQLKPGADSAIVSRQVDELFRNSFAETLTESETAFQQSFVSMSATIITALHSISLVVVVIMLLVLTNTTLMASRERYREYSILKALGFSRRHLVALLLGESAVIGVAAFCFLLLFLSPFFVLEPKDILGDLIAFFPVFRISAATLLSCLGLIAAVAAIAGLIPLWSIFRMSVVDGLRRIG